jgi:hypothetical protein
LDNSRHPRFHLPARVIRPSLAITLAGLLTLAGACADTFTPASAARAEQMLEGAAIRFAPNVYDARYNTARVKLAQSALVPSRIFDDTSVWSARPSPTLRSLFVSGTLAADGRYHFDARIAPPTTSRIGDSYHTITLEQVASNQFRWDTRVEHALGSISADEVAAALDALFSAPEGRTARTLRDDYRGAFPRATTAFGRGFVLDSAAVVPAGAGITSVMLRFAFRPELMKRAFPALADYLDKYLGPAKYHFVLTDRSGVALFDMVGRDRAMTIRYRLSDGKLVSLLGPTKPWPDSLTLMADVALKVKLFTVGLHELRTDFVISNTSSGTTHERAWTIVAQHEPKWDLPLITERLISSPLRHPFEGQGSSFQLAFRDSGSGGQTVFSRRTRLQVQESAIMRFLGSLASRAVGDLDERVEQEEHRFLREGLRAAELDLRAATGSR